MFLSQFVSRLSVSLLISCAFIGSVPTVSNSSRAEANETQSTPPLPQLLGDPHSARTADSIKRNEIYANTQKLFAANDYDGLDALANSLRKSQGAYLNGSWWIDTFYKAIDSVPRTDSDEAWLNQIGKVQAWVKKKPQSITAHVSSGILWKSYAWKARGGGYADTVTDAMWKTYSERLAHCVDEVKVANALKETCPGQFRLQLILLRANGWNATQENQIFANCQKRYPTYLTNYGEKFTSLLPRWHGQPGDSEKFIEQNVSQLKGQQADKTYARLVWAVDNYGTGLCWNLFSETKLSYPRCRAGFTELLKAMPNNQDVLSEFAQLADYADDKETARVLFQRLGNNYSSFVFKTAAGFTSARAHAYSSKLRAHT